MSLYRWWPFRPQGLRVALLAWVLLVAACGGGGDDASPTVASTASAAPSGDEEAIDTTTPAAADGEVVETTKAQGSPDGGGVAPGTGVVEIGEFRYDLDVDQCFSLAGAFGGFGFGTGARHETSFDFDFPPPDYETRADAEDWNLPSIRVEDDAGTLDWRTGSSEVLDGTNWPDGIDREEIMVQTWNSDVDDGRVTGTATFVDLNTIFFQDAQPALVAGTFELHCPD